MSISEEKTPEAVAAERQKVKKKLKRRLLPCILAGFSLPFTLFLYGPFDLFAQNRGEFQFSLYDFIFPFIVLTLICGAVLSVIPLFLKKKAYSLYLAILFWASVMFFIQGNYLNFGLTSLAGDGFSAGPSLLTVIVNTAIWVLSLAAVIVCVLLFKPVRKKLRVVVSLGLCIVFIMQATGVVAASFNENVYADKQTTLSAATGVGKKILTTQNLTTLSPKKNVVLFLVDKFDVRYFRDVLKYFPDAVSELTGFTSYDNYVTMYQRTYPGTTSTFTATLNDFTLEREDYFKKAYSESPSLLYMHENGYDINVYTDHYYSYEDASVMQEYADNVSQYEDYVIKDKVKLFSSMLALSMYRYFPYVLKTTVENIDTGTFFKLVEYKMDDGQTMYSTDNRTVYNNLTAEDFALTEEEKRLNIIHIFGCHWPANYDYNWNDLSEPDNSTENITRQTFKIIGRYIEQMKALGVYEDSTIVITGDHPIYWSDTDPLDGPRVTAMLVKPSGVSEGEFKISNAQVSQIDLWPTIFECEGIEENAPQLGGTSFFDIAEDEQRVRYYTFQRLLDGTDEELVYKVVGDANDFSNWEIVERRAINFGFS